MHNRQPKPNLRCKKKALSRSEVLLEMVGLEVMVEGVRAGTHSDNWRQRVPDCRRSCDAETVGARHGRSQYSASGRADAVDWPSTLHTEGSFQVQTKPVVVR